MARLDPFASPTRNVSTKMESLFLDSSPDFGPVKCEMNKIRAIGDMTAPVVPHAGYRERSLRLRHVEDDKNVLIDDLILQLEKSQYQLQQMRLDYERDQQHLHDCREREESLLESQLAMRTLLDRNAYVTVLLDGDSLTFHKNLWVRGEEGGREAARLLQDFLVSFAKQQLQHLPEIVVHAKLFLNMRSLSETLGRLMFVDKAALLESFLQGLSDADYVLDVIDTSLSKGLTTKKIKESYRHDFINVHCHQVFLAVLSSDILNALFDEHPDIRPNERVTILEPKNITSNDKLGLERESEDAPFKRINMDALLVKIPTEPVFRPTPVTKIATPVLTRIESNSSSMTLNSLQNQSSVASTPAMTWAAISAQPFVPKAGEVQSGSSTPLYLKTPPVMKASIATSTVPRNKNDQRVDTVDDSIPYQELQRIKKMKLCNIYYLQGKNSCDGTCNHSHTYALMNHEKSVLKEVARMTPCYYQLDCDDPACIYGHRCPQSKPGKKDCFYKGDCRFSGWGHGIDTKVVRTQHIK